MSFLTRGVGVTFSSLSVPNYRRYAVGQGTSLVGTWMQMTAQAWLVLSLTGSPTTLGFIVALQTLPMLVLGPYGGVIADRLDKRRLMIGLQSLMGLQAALLGLLTASGMITVWEVGGLALLLGVNNAFETPARQAFVLEIVGPSDLRNAVSLNSTMVNAARAVGPAAAGLVIAVAGDAWCFFANSASFAAVVISLVTMDRTALQPSRPAARASGQIREGLRYVRATPGLAVPLVMMALVGTFAYEFQVTLPVMAKHTFHSGPAAFGLVTSAMGLGAVVGGLITAAKGKTGLRPLSIASGIFGIALLLAASAPTFGLELAALAVVGWAGVSFLSMANSTLQLETEPHMRGRVMSLWSVAFIGSTPIGGPIVGYITEQLGARVGLEVGAVACVLAAAIGARYLSRDKITAPLGRDTAAGDGPAVDEDLDPNSIASGIAPPTATPAHPYRQRIRIPGHRGAVRGRTNTVRAASGCPRSNWR